MDAMGTAYQLRGCLLNCRALAGAEDIRTSPHVSVSLIALQESPVNWSRLSPPAISRTQGHGKEMVAPLGSTRAIDDTGPVPVHCLRDGNGAKLMRLRVVQELLVLQVGRKRTMDQCRLEMAGLDDAARIGSTVTVRDDRTFAKELPARAGMCVRLPGW